MLELSENIHFYDEFEVQKCVTPYRVETTLEILII